MKIKYIHLNKYKRFYDLTIDLGEPKRIVALVGPNGCGKSSIFDAMLFLNNTFNAIGSTGSKNYTYHSLEQNSSYGYRNVQIEFDRGNYNLVRDQLVALGLHTTIFTFRSSFRFNGGLHVSSISEVSDLKENNYGASSASDIDQRIEQNYRRLNIKYRKFMNQNDARPSEAKAHIIGELNSAIKNCLNLWIDEIGDVEAGRGTLFFRKEDTINAFEYSVLSAGEKEVIDLLLDLYLRKDEYVDSIYIIDEPELHLNTAIQRKLLLEINKMVPQNCQIWVATHSIGFLRALQEELAAESQIIQFDENNKWAKQAYTLTPMVKNRTKWKELFSTALEDLTELVAPKRIIYCEGKDRPTANGEEKGLDAIVFNTIFGESHPDTFFVSSGGNTELDQKSDIALMILSKVFKGLEILVLKDRDMASGKVVDEKARQLYLSNNPQSHRVLKRFEIENYLFDKEVLKKYCNQESLLFDETEYDKFVTDIINMQIKDEYKRIKNFCNIVSNINKEKFKQNLAKVITSDMVVYQELEKEIFNRE